MEHNFEQLSEEQLQLMSAQIEAELATRDKRKKAEAARQIKALAEAAGLTVNVSEKCKKKRGRPANNSA